MSSQLFLLQREKSQNTLPNTAIFSEDTSAVFARIDEYNWLNYKNKHRCMTASLSQLSSMSSRTLKKCIPIGSIEFVEKVLQLAYNIPQIAPIIIPDEIMSHPEWICRRIAVKSSIKYAQSVFDEFGAEELFVKSASCLKTDYTGIYRRSDILPQTSDAIFFSDRIDIVSEWRVFVSRSRFVDLQCYAGDPWLIPDKQTVLDMIASIGSKYPAYTLDVGIITEPAQRHRTVVIEVHNFISCGLYGAVIPLHMYVDAYRYEVKSRIR